LQVFINGRFASQAVTGVQRYAEELLRALDQELERTRGLGPRPSFCLLVPPDARRVPTFQRINSRRVGRLRGHPWEQLELPWYARGGLLLSLANTGPLLQRRQVVALHDASAFAMPQAYSLAFRRWYQFLLPALGRIACRIITVSEFSRSELIRHARIPGHKLRVIGESGEHIRRAQADCDVLERLGLRSRGYVLAVSSHGPHKNFKVVADALEHLGSRAFDVVIAGGYNPRIFGRTRDQIESALKVAGYVSDGELRALYENAACFIYPSLYEGFGLPPLEAMTCGCPVVASREASLPEVCANAALYCDARDPVSVAESIQQVVGDSALQDDLRARGKQRASEFSWSRSARALLAVIEEAAGA
jgi:glycosyltransferase involved in cell wall biosynthesis